MVVRLGDAWLLELQFLEPFTATRRLQLSTCSDARSAARALLVLGLQGAERFAQAPPPLSAPPLTTSDVIVSAPSRARLGLRAGGWASFFSVPVPTPRISLMGVVLVRALELELSARTGFSTQFAGGPASGAAVRIWPTLGGEASGCWAPVFGRWRLGVCGSALVEWWQLRGEGVSDPREGHGVSVALGPTAKLALELMPGLELGLNVAGRVALRRPEARFAGVPAVVAGPVALDLGLWLGWLQANH